jgi:uncharacterized protein YciI
VKAVQKISLVSFLERAAASASAFDKDAHFGGFAMHYILFYDVVDDYLERRAQFREQHLEYAKQAHERGDLFLAGALADPVDGAMLVFRGQSPAAAEAFAKADPYVTNGLIKSWRVRKWLTVIGDGTAPA